MLSNSFNFPCVDHLIEGVHYTIIDWNFAEGCPEGEKMVFGACRKLRDGSTDDKDFDSSKKTKQEEEAEGEAKKQGSDVKSNKPVMVNGKKMGWAVKNGKPVMVEWGSVAGEKKVGSKKPKPSQSPKPKNVQTPAPAPKPATALVNPDANSADRQSAINEIGRRTLAT
jgi:hypothetical protein